MFKALFISAGLLSFSTMALAQQQPQTGKYALGVQASRTVGRQLAAGTAPAALGGQRTSFSEQRSIVENLQAVGGYATLVLSAERAALIEQLQGSGPFTVFAPSDAAFGRMPAELRASLWKPAGQAQLRAMLAAHIVQGRLAEADLTDGRVLLTLAGTPLTVRRVGGRVALEDSRGKRAVIDVSDLSASNGLAHSLDAVLMQP